MATVGGPEGQPPIGGTGGQPQLQNQQVKTETSGAMNFIKTKFESFTSFLSNLAEKTVFGKAIRNEYRNVVREQRFETAKDKAFVAAYDDLKKDNTNLDQMTITGVTEDQRIFRKIYARFSERVDVIKNNFRTSSDDSITNNSGTNLGKTEYYIKLKEELEKEKKDMILKLSQMSSGIDITLSPDLTVNVSKDDAVKIFSKLFDKLTEQLDNIANEDKKTTNIAAATLSRKKKSKELENLTKNLKL